MNTKKGEREEGGKKYDIELKLNTQKGKTSHKDFKWMEWYFRCLSVLIEFCIKLTASRN